MKKYSLHLLFCFATVLALLPSRLSAQTTIFFENFENRTSFASNWRVEGFYGEEDPVLWGIVNREFGNEATHSGTNKIYCAANRFGNDPANPVYENGMGTFFERDVDLTGYNSATLTFWYRFKVFKGTDEDPFDEYSTDYFSVLIDESEVFSTFNFSEPVHIGAWTRVTLDISEFAGRVVPVRFEFTSDASSQDEGSSTAGEGAYVDDVMVVGTPANRPDLNRDGSQDLLLHHTDGRASSFYFSGTQYRSNQWLNANKTLGGWRIAAQADFDRDYEADLLLHHAATGKTMAWIMNGIVRERQVAMRTMPLGWKVAATADFDRRGAQDILWQHTNGNLMLWYMNPTNHTAFLSQASLPPIGSQFKVVGAADFNYDGSPDLIHQAPSSGSLRVRFLNGRTTLSTSFITLPSTIKISPAWRLVGTQDFNGDRQVDLIMHHTNGTIAVWLLDGLKVTEQKILRTLPTAYSVAGHR